MGGDERTSGTIEPELNAHDAHATELSAPAPADLEAIVSEEPPAAEPLSSEDHKENRMGAGSTPEPIDVTPVEKDKSNNEEERERREEEEQRLEFAAEDAREDEVEHQKVEQAEDIMPSDEEKWDDLLEDDEDQDQGYIWLCPFHRSLVQRLLEQEDYGPPVVPRGLPEADPLDKYRSWVASPLRQCLNVDDA